MNLSNEINILTEEYSLLIREYVTSIGNSAPADDGVKQILISEGEWSPLASEHLLNLVHGYGSFMLKNALALSLALQIEDGKLGF